MGNVNPIDLIREEDLDMWTSFGFILYGSMKSFAEIREMIEAYMDEKKGEFLIHSTCAANKLFIVKEKEYEKLKAYDND